MRPLIVAVLSFSILLCVAPAWSQDEADASGWGDLSEFEAEAPIFNTRAYGYIDAYGEKVFKSPAGVDSNGETIYEGHPYEFDVLNLHLMFQGDIRGKYRFFLNLAAPGAGSNTSDEALSVRNAWVEVPLLTGYLNLRVGKTYRQFGLYNEILDAVPTFIGIEAPELFDKDHLMLTRTTNVMLLGSAPVGDSVTVNYALTTGNDEHADDALPVGGDVHMLWGTHLKLGTSFYTTNGQAIPSRGVGEGSPRGGVLNWMETDRYVVYGGYGQVSWEGLLVQLAFWQAAHDGLYDEDSVLALAEGDLNARQRARFFAGGDPSNGLARQRSKYKVTTYYLRSGYELTLGDGWTLTPYVQVDYYKNPEVVADKALGGDAEAGLADDGAFFKYTGGLVLRPVPEIAFKVDGSTHVLDFNGESVSYPEVRFSLSYLWQLGQ